MTRLKYVTEVIAGQSPASQDVNIIGEGLPFLQGNAEFEESSPVPRYECSTPPKRCQKGDLLLSVRAPVGAVNIADRPYGIGRGLCAISPRDVVPNYLRWWLHHARPQLEERATGSTFAAVSTATVGDLRLPDIPQSRQRAIADYLDRETARIDTLIEEQQRLIEMLRERRQAVIDTAVARGLEPLVDVKVSGLPGAEEVPLHWDVLPLRYAITFQEGPGIMAVDFRDEGVPLLRVSSVRMAVATLDGCNYLEPALVAKRWAHFQVDLGDLLISASASMGTVSEVTAETVGAVPYTGIIRIKPGRMVKDFIRWFVVSGEFIDQVDSLKTGSTIQHFGPTHLARMRVALPPAKEQCRIASYLDAQSAKIGALIHETERFIELSRERRSALITAAVTGQIDVREVA